MTREDGYAMKIVTMMTRMVKPMMQDWDNMETTQYVIERVVEIVGQFQGENISKNLKTYNDEILQEDANE